LYVLEEKSSIEIANMIEISKPLILKLLKEEGIPRRNNKEAHLVSGRKMRAHSQQELESMKEQFYQWYIVEKKSATKISKILGLSKQCVLDRLKKVGVEVRSPQEEAFIQYKKNIKKPSNDQLKRWYIDERKSTRDISQIVGVSSTTIGNWLKKCNIFLRKGNYRKF